MFDPSELHEAHWRSTHSTILLYRRQQRVMNPRSLMRIHRAIDREKTKQQFIMMILRTAYRNSRTSGTNNS